MSEDTEILKKINENIEATKRANMAMLALLSGGATPSQVAGAMGSSDDLQMPIGGELFVEQGKRIASVRRSGVSGFFDRLSAMALPDPERSVESIAYSNLYGYRGASRSLVGFATKLQQVGEIAQMSLTPNRPEGQPMVVDGRRQSYSSGLDSLSQANRNVFMNPRQEDVDEMLRTGFITQDEHKIFKKWGTDPTAGATWRKMMEGKLAQGANITDIIGTEGRLGKAAASAAGVEGFAGSALGSSLFNFGGGLIGAASKIAGPIAIAAEIGQQVYKGIDAFYGFGRGGAALGYGFSANPFSQGAQVDMSRSIQTKLDALFSFGLSESQTSAARSAVESMGLGGPGRDKMYNAFYSSMTDVMEQTQLSGQTLSPVYEQFMRAGGSTKDIGQLTKMLKDDLPKAAAASRMSLENFAQSMVKTAQAAAQSPYNVRTQFELQQAQITAAAGGAPPGMQAISTGQNMFVNAMAATAGGVSIFRAQQNPQALNMAALEFIKKTLGSNADSAEAFDNYRLNSDEGALKVIQLQRILNLSVDDIRNLIATGGLSNREQAQMLTSGISLDAAKTHVEKATAGRLGGHAGATTDFSGIRLRDETVTTSQMIKGTSIDLYNKNTTGAQVQAYFRSIGKTQEIDKALLQLDPSEDKYFRSHLKELQGKGQGKEMFDFIQQEAKKAASLATQEGAPKIDLQEDVKRWFKMEFKNNPPARGAANDSFGSGTTQPSSGPGNK